MTYAPRPEALDEVALPDELRPWLEKIAENAHEVWALGRIEEGWVYGPEYDGDKKTHPCLVPYERLPESEKDYDRRTSGQALKFLIKNGFAITRKEPVSNGVRI